MTQYHTRITTEGSRQWLLATQRLDGRIDFDAAAAIRRQIGADFTGMQIEVDAQRGEGPRTDWENHMIATCTGRD